MAKQVHGNRSDVAFKLAALRRHRSRLSRALALLLTVALLGVAGGIQAKASPAIAASTGTWAAAGSMTTPRYANAAVRVFNGEVLSIGGRDSSDHLNSAEVYNPQTGTWAPTGSMAVARYGPTATVLPNGQVLVAGGQDSTGAVISSTELYDPATGTWSSTGSMTTPRQNHTATLLGDGRVLVVGGCSDSACNQRVANAELYNPSTGIWTAIRPELIARAWHTATLLPNGQVLVTGGRDSVGNALASAELYNPSTGRWSFTRNMATARWTHTATLFTSGPHQVRVLVTGGMDSASNALASAELYNPSTGRWSFTGSMATARWEQSATLLQNGQVLVAGGSVTCPPCTVLASAELYNPRTGTWTATGSLTTARVLPAALLLQDGSVLVMGGCGNLQVSGCAQILASAELYIPTRVALLARSGQQVVSGARHN